MIRNQPSPTAKDARVILSEEQSGGLVEGPPTQPAGWVPWAVALLTSAIAAALIYKVFDVDTTVLLAVQYAFWAICAFALVGHLRQRTLKLRLRSPVNAWLIAFLVALAVTTFLVWFRDLRTDMSSVFLQTAALGYMAMAFFVMQSAAKAVDVKAAVLLTCHVILGLCLYSILSDASGITQYESGHGRIFGALGDPAAWALTLPLVVYFSSGRLILAAVTGLTLVVTGSRGPALVVVASFLLLMALGRGRRFYNALMLLMLAVASVLQARLFTTLVDRFGATQFTSNDRLVTARLGIADFLSSPFTGLGYNSLSHFHRATIHNMQIGVLPTQTSTFVQMLSDGGVSLFFTYFIFVVFCTYAGLVLMRRANIVQDAGVTNGVVAWLLAMLWLNQSALWFVVGSYIGPLVFGMAGIVSGYWARIRLIPRDQAQAPLRI